MRLGELYHISVINLINCIMYDLNMHDFSLLHVEFRVSGNSPPGDACQFSVLWVPLRNRLAVKSCIARRHTPANQISRFLMNCLSVMNT